MGIIQSSFQLSDFPKDRTLRQIVGLGTVTRDPRTFGGVNWEVFLRPVSNQSERFNSGKIASVRVSSAYLACLGVGTLWRGQQYEDINPKMRPMRALRIDAGDQEIVWRHDCEETGETRFFHSKREANGPPYIRIKVLEDERCDFAYVRCSEVARFYFGQSSLLAEELFNFDSEARNDRLYNFERSGSIAEGTGFRICLRRKVRKQVAYYLAVNLAKEVPRAALIQLSRSVRAARASDRPAWPELNIPVEGINDWQVYGHKRSALRVDHEGAGHRENVVAISLIRSCSAEVSLHPLYIEMPHSTRSGKLDGLAPPRRAISSLKDNLPMTSSEFPGAATGGRLDIILDVLEGRPNLSIEDCEVHYSEEEARDLPPSYIAGEGDISRLSALSNGPGPESIAECSILPDLPIEPQESVGDREEVEVDRSQLPDLFKVSQDEWPEHIATNFENIPEEFNSVIWASIEWASKHSHCSVRWGNGIEIEKNFEEASLLKLPGTWLPRSAAKKGLVAVRRALCIDVFVPGGKVLILDIERLSKSECFGIQVMYLPGHKVVSRRILGNIIHWRLFEGLGWPNTSTHSGDFMSRTMKHDFSTHANMRMLNRLEGSLFSLCPSLYG